MFLGELTVSLFLRLSLSQTPAVKHLLKALCLFLKNEKGDSLEPLNAVHSELAPFGNVPPFHHKANRRFDSADSIAANKT
jgi:hypothetical protein